MATYEYQARTPSGEPLRGQLSAGDEAAARRELAARGLTIVELRSCPADDGEGTLDEQQITTFVQAVGAAAAVRVPLEVTLAALAEERDDPRLAAVAQRLATNLQQGATMEQAVASVEHELPAEVRGLLQAGVERGDLAGTFERFAEQRLASQRIERRIRAAIAYPLLILAILVPLLLFLSLYVIPIFADLYEEFDLQLPQITLLILQTARQMPGLVAGVALCALIVPLLVRVIGGRWLFHRVRAALPLLGGLWTASGQREFAALLASFLELRAPLTEAVRNTGQIMNDRNVARACGRVSQRLESGQTLSRSLGQSIHFDRSLVALVAWGETYGLVPDALRIATDLFDDQIEQQASLIHRLLPPMTLVLVATLMFFVVVGLMVPLIKLIASLS
jgi:type II secretory pathway component PulF